jgi:hypothetical protein
MHTTHIIEKESEGDFRSNKNVYHLWALITGNHSPALVEYFPLAYFLVLYNRVLMPKQRLLKAFYAG